MSTIPKPLCVMGYPESQLKVYFGDAYPAFQDWMYGQTGAICEGRRYNPTTSGYDISCGGESHGLVIYPWDVERFVAGLPVID